MANRILTIGELLWDMLPGERKLGGAPANFACRMGSLGNEVWLVSSLGNDGLGREAREQLSACPMDISFVQENSDYPTGTVNVFFDADRNPDYEIVSGAAYDYIVADEQIRKLAEHVDCLAFGSLAQRSEVTRNTISVLIRQASQALKFCDINLRKECYTIETLTHSMKNADILKLN